MDVLGTRISNAAPVDELPEHFNGPSYWQIKVQLKKISHL